MSLIRVFEGAAVHPQAEIAEGVEIGHFTTIGPNVRIGRGTRVGSNCTIDGHTTIGERNTIFSHAVIGTAPQDLKHKGQPTKLEIGDGNTIREFVTINVGTELGGGVTRIGNNNMLMACCHVAHDCILNDNIILSNNCLLGGHIQIDSHAIICGASVVHHFATIGRHAFIGGLTRVSRDIPPFMIYVGSPPKVLGVNIVGLKRHGFNHDTIAALKEAHRYFFRSDESTDSAITKCEDLISIYPEVRFLIEFIHRTQSGKFGRALEGTRRFG